MMNVAIIGVGHWGPNLVRNFLNHPSTNKIYCYDLDKKRMDIIQKKYPTIEAAQHYAAILDNSSVDAVVLATPASTHFDLARQALKHGKHVLVEKPLAANPEQGKILVDTARDKDVKLMVDHINIYNGAIKKIKDIIDSDVIGKIMYFNAVRTSAGLIQSDVNVLWDLAIHDLYVMDYLVAEEPDTISVAGVRHFSELEEVAFLTLFSANNYIAHLHVNWLSPVRIRRIAIGGTKKTIIFDDMAPVEKIKMYDIANRKILSDNKKGDFEALEYDITEPLASVTNEFIDAIDRNREPLTNGETGLKIVNILAAAEKSMKKNGTPIGMKGK